MLQNFLLTLVSIYLSVCAQSAGAVEYSDSISADR